MRKNDLISQLLKLHADWSISSFEVDTSSNRTDITLRHKTQKKWFSRSVENTNENTIVLRHLPLLGMRTYLHFFKPSIEAYGQDWYAVHNATLTKEMELFVFEALKLCKNIHAVKQLTHLSTVEIQHISDATGIAPNSPDTPIPKTHDMQAPVIDDEATRIDYVSQRSFELTHSDKLPPETDVAWTRLLDGKIPINPKSVALQMLLQQIRNRNKSNPTEINRLAGTKLLRTYMIKNQNKHREEIGALHGNFAAKHSVKQVENKPRPIVAKLQPTIDKKTLPSINHPCWLDIINKNIQINTNKVGLQMIMQQVVFTGTRRSVADPTRNARILYNFFLKHQNRLKEEIAQIHTFISTEKSTHAPQKAALPPPPISAAIWDQIITGEIAVDTQSVSMQMMMQSITLAIRRDDSELSKIAATKILQKFFFKNQRKLQNEIRQLVNAPINIDVNEPQPADHKVPPDTHPSWQKLINGELEIATDIVALKMMLQRIRISIDKNPSDNSRIAGVKILRRYFLKHKNKHQAEINQLLVA